LRAAGAAGAVFAVVAAASAAGWLLPTDQALLRAVLAARSCTAVALSGLASFVGAIEVVALLTGLLALALLGASWGPRALWVGGWVLSLPLELALKLSVRHPHPVTVSQGPPLVCEGPSPLTNPALSPFTNPSTPLLMNPEAQVLQPLGAAVGHTFPSGYTTRVAFFAVLLGFWLWGRLSSPWRGWALGAVAVLALALVYTRLVLLWHWPSDVLGGAALGTAMACAARAGWALTPGGPWRRSARAAKPAPPAGAPADRASPPPR
jgi:membrane-associated phospholipid phosphatase